MRDPLSDVVSRRLSNHKLTRSDLRQPSDVVAWLGAVQAQDYSVAKWGLGLRASGLSDAAVEKAFTDGVILRTHVMRPTWHFVTPFDIRWMLALTASRVKLVMAHYDRKLELDKRVLARSYLTLECALQGNKYLTRGELAAALARARIHAIGQRLGHLMMHAELDQVICSGPRRGRQFTYALLEERAPRGRSLTREEALAELARRYFSSHGPATVRDFAWWSGSTMRDARTAIDLVKPPLLREVIGTITYWSATSRAAAAPASSFACLLPNYDEYLVAYKDRHLVVGSAAAGKWTWPATPGSGHHLLLEGRLTGSWKRIVSKDAILVKTTLFRRPTRADVRAIEAAAERFATFVDLPVTLSIA
jgi:hypothetical protein